MMSGQLIPKGQAEVGAALKRFLMFTLVLSGAFFLPLQALLRLSSHSELYSLIPAIPFISAYFVWTRRKEVLAVNPGFNLPALLLAGLGVVALIASFLLRTDPKSAAAVDPLSARIFAFCCLLVAGALVCFGSATMKRMVFPAAMLVFFVPFPGFIVDGLEAFFQHASADAAAGMIRLTGTPLLRHGMVFEMPGMTISVAPECSGIRSSLVLFITSLLAGQMFLRRTAFRWILTLVVVPLGIVRNGFRILTISWLCVHVSPTMIDSPIHHHGGPFFFALSLVPFFLILIWLIRREKRLSAGTNLSVAPKPGNTGPTAG